MAAPSSHMSEKFRYEFTVTPGLEAVAERELKATQWGQRASVETSTGALCVVADAPYPRESILRTATALYEVLEFAVPRPKALLGHQNLTRVVRACQAVLTPQYKTIAISAAGKSTEVMQRLIAELATALHLQPSRDNGDLHLRIRRSTHLVDGWSVLIRQTPRPWATRAWRVENLPGSLHGPVAAALAMLADLRPQMRVLNAGCGSGTIAVECRLIQPEVRLIAVDIEWAHAQLTQKHLKAAMLSPSAILSADVRALPFADASFDAVLSDLPFGQLMGRDSNLSNLYSAWLREAARVTIPDGRGIFLTHAVRLMMEVLAGAQGLWHVEKVMPITLNGLHPRIFLLKRRNGQLS